MRLRKTLKAVGFILAAAGLILVGVLYYQGQQAPRTNSAYVALGSSFAAGLGLGELEPGSPFVCQRSTNGYPQQYARLAGLDLTDMTCSGATVQHVLHGGQVFLGPQIDALGPDTRLVTFTAGGNDVAYVGDLTAIAYVRAGGMVGFFLDLFWDGAQPVAKRNLAGLQTELAGAFREIRRRAPNARLVVISYPAIIPATGTCPQLGIDTTEAEMMRLVGQELDKVTRLAASEAEAEIVDMAAAVSGHDACSAEPWINGSAPALGAPFHPTLAGARGVADQLAMRLRTVPSSTNQEQ